MTMVKIVEASVAEETGIPIYTFHVRYWRAIHAEIMTHRAFSRNARSSRAVPSLTLLSESIFTPQFGMNKPGMQSELLAPPELQERWAQEWQDLATICREYVERWQADGMHKQWANRPLEWFGWIDVLITSTYWDNFFDLRISEYAQPEFDMLARAMQSEMSRCNPVPLKHGEWHLPYITREEREHHTTDTLQKLSVARCARLSYKPFDGSNSYEAELARYEKLVVAQPVHASPAEHQATPDKLLWNNVHDHRYWEHPELHGNLAGWQQYRKMLPGEARMENWVLTR
jgi:hypothetical protein